MCPFGLQCTNPFRNCQTACLPSTLLMDSPGAGGVFAMEAVLQGLFQSTAPRVFGPLVLGDVVYLPSRQPLSSVLQGGCPNV